MEAADFFDKVEEHKELEGVSAKDGEAVVRHSSGLKTSVGIEAIMDNDWNTIEDVLTGKREPAALKHMTRVVGYYSSTNNWNKSKLGELKDRQAGSYAL